MKNPFTFLKNLFVNENERQAIRKRREKDRDTKKETGRSKSGGSNSTEQKVTEEKAIKDRKIWHRPGLTKTELKQKIKNRKRNKMARRSRRINRLKAA